MTDTQLKSCPFCGSLAESALYQDDRWIECPRCQQGISGDADCITAEALIDIWNTRPIEEAFQARIAELELILAADKLIEDGWIGRIEAGDKRIAELEAALDKAAHQLYDYSGSCPSDLYDWEHPRSCSKVCAGYEDPSEAWECWLDWLLSSKENECQKQ